MAKENIQWGIVMKDGNMITCNVKAPTIFAAADEILQSFVSGDFKNKKLKAEDVRQIIDIPG